jgi:hypothetical protein
MKRSLTAPAMLAAITLSMGAVSHGGFQLEAEIPQGQEMFGNAVLVIHTRGCAHPENAKVSATALGIVGSKKVTKKLELNLVRKGVYTIDRQWADEGSWLLAVTGKYRGYTSSLIVGLEEDATFEGFGRWTGKLDNGYPVRLLDRDVTNRDLFRAFEEMGD